MKNALAQSGEIIEAGENAPQAAICPHCKGVLKLRSRRYGTKPDEVTYFWRHKDYANPDCFARFNAVNYQRRKNE